MGAQRDSGWRAGTIAYRQRRSKVPPRAGPGGTAMPGNRQVGAAPHTTPTGEYAITPEANHQLLRPGDTADISAADRWSAPG